jgi:hypothetical protein
MQAVFLDSGKKSSGTGVFLPQGAGTNMQSRKKPGTASFWIFDRMMQVSDPQPCPRVCGYFSHNHF